MAKDGNLSGIVRDFKKFTSKQIVAAIESNEQESRKDWTLRLFQQAGAANSRNSSYRPWRQGNGRKECFGKALTLQKPEYIHNNTVTAGLLAKPEDYVYGSAKAYFTNKQSALLPVVCL